MRTLLGRSLGVTLQAVVYATLALLATSRAAWAHTGEDVPLSHVILEVAQWSLGAATVIAVLVGLLWVRARLRGRGQ